MRPLKAAVLAVLAFLTACSENGVDPQQENSGLPRPELRIGWMHGRDGNPVQVTYQVVAGRGRFEGDVDLGPADRIPSTREQLQGRLPAGVRGSSVITGSMYRWYPPTGTGAVVPYEIDPSLPSPQRVFDAMTHVSSRVATIRFVQRTTEADYVRFVPGTENVCTSQVGRQGGQQLITLHDNCSVGATIHELGHALGLWHEHTRCDRDTYVEIRYENIHPYYAFAFDKHCSTSTTDPNAGTDYYAYDEGSIMHYEPKAFSYTEQPTIVSRRGLDHLMGQRDALSSTDANTLATLYPSRRRAS